MIKTVPVRVLDSDGAQTDVIMVQGTASKKIKVLRVTATADGSNTGPVNIKVGFAISAAALGTPNPTPSISAIDGIVFDFLGMPAGGSATVGDGTGPLGIGKEAESLKYTCEDPAGGAITIVATYEDLQT